MGGVQSHLFVTPCLSGLVLGDGKVTAQQMPAFTPAAQRDTLRCTWVLPGFSVSHRAADSAGVCRAESSCLVMCDTAGGGRRLILSLLKITSTYWAESLARHCLGFCISLKNTSLWSFVPSAACLFPHSDSLRGRLSGSCSQPRLCPVLKCSLCDLLTTVTRRGMFVQHLTFPTRALRAAVWCPHFPHKKAQCGGG